MSLYPFQAEGVRHLQGARVRLLADDMGLGKTLQAIRSSEDHGRPVTVLAPAILVAEWRDEVAKWGDIPRSVAVVGTKRGPDPRTADVTLCSYNRATRPETWDMLRRRRDAHLILDECHYLKEPAIGRTTAALGSAKTPGLASRAARVSFLTGTPVPNNAGELYMMLWTAGLYEGSHWDFLHDFCNVRRTPWGQSVTSYKDPEGLRQLLDGFMLRRTNVVELPSTARGEIVVEPDAAADPGALRAVRNVDSDTADMIERAAKAGDFDRLETPHLASIRRAVGLAKAHATAKQARDILAGDASAKMVLFCIHRDVISILADELKDFAPVCLVGGDTDKKRKRLIDQFQNDTGTRVAVCQIKAAGVGLTLTAANHLWLVEPSWSPADNDQAERRIVRIGQTRKTSIMLVSLADSIDQAVNGVLRKKRQLIDEILNPDCD